ncbi:hypothetical protein A9Q84_09350 [Halobacteriovorax marinus]|uniref:Thioredoxin domain-containing protein n=1 Tax=Halobacteriovorax marinus TaxID=97084 RepID=A0A1Y5F6X4_9BACT|nr:hypothetical protein A9Q84_09350 [Halobacteriovorax marinus]
MGIKLIPILLMTLLLNFSNSVFASNSKEVIPDLPVKATVSTFNDGTDNYLSLSYKNYPHWHTYWKNPGDAGLPLMYFFEIDGKKVTLEELEWPVPKKYIEEGNMLAFGYEGQYSLFFKLPKKYSNGSFKIKSNWLVCKHICIPGQINFSGNIRNGNIEQLEGATLEVSKSTLLNQLKDLPAKRDFPSNLDIVLAKSVGDKENKLTLYYNLSLEKPGKFNLEKNLLTPYPAGPFTFVREKVFIDSKNNLYAKHTIEWDGEYMEPEIPLPLSGKFKKPYTLKFLYANPENGKVEIIEHDIHTYSLTAATRFEKFTELLKPLEAKSVIKTQVKTEIPKAESETSLFSYLLLAFIGGLILNFMPCVLPVISIKLFSLIKNRNEDRSRVLKHNLSYTLGILSTFSLLALTIILFKGAGEQVGWGFQLQSPTFVLVMIFALFIFSLNLFGLFEFNTPGGSHLGDVKTKDSFFGDFLSGVLATVLSTPCSAPFLGAALTFAFTSSNSIIFLVFLFVGLGLAFPFLVTGFIPSTISFLPKPGMWMEKLKKFLGLTLVLTTLWLMDVYSALIEDSTELMLKLNIALSLCFFAFYLAKHITKSKVIKAISHILYLSLIVNIVMTPIVPSVGDSSSKLLNEKNSKGLAWEKWSEDSMKKYSSTGQLVFIDFTAKWCFTCKVNERLVIDTDKFKNLVEKKNIKLLLADWTKRDVVIGNWLKKNGFVGVPAYFVINKKGELKNLGETITISEIRESLN